MSLRWSVDMLNPAMRAQAQRKIDQLRAVSTERTVVLPGAGVKVPPAMNGQTGPRKNGKPLIPTLSKPCERLKFYLRAEGLGHFVEEHRFDPVRKWRIDICFLDEKLAIEVDGVTPKGGGRHQRAEGFTKDAIKHNAMVLAGFRLLRFTQPMVRTVAIQTIKQALGLNPNTEEGRKC